VYINIHFRIHSVTSPASTLHKTIVPCSERKCGHMHCTERDLQSATHGKKCCQLLAPILHEGALQPQTRKPNRFTTIPVTQKKTQEPSNSAWNLGFLVWPPNLESKETRGNGLKVYSPPPACPPVLEQAVTYRDEFGRSSFQNTSDIFNFENKKNQIGMFLHFFASAVFQNATWLEVIYFKKVSIVNPNKMKIRKSRRGNTRECMW